MTMLDSMRRHIGWLKWSLGLVILAFAFLYIPDLSNSTPQLTGALTDVVATVGEREITVGEFRTVYLRQLRNYQAQSGGEITAEILRSMGLDRQILQQMIDEYAALQEAERLGVTVTDKEIRDRIVSFPAFQQNGQFVGEQAYIQSLRLQSPPMTPAQFEEDIRRSLMLERLQAAVTDWITVTDEDLRREHVRRSETISVSAISFRADDFREGIEATDADVAALFAQNAVDYTVPEKRQLRFVLINVAALKESFTPSDDDVQGYYGYNTDRYTEPVTLRASHILLRTEGKDLPEVQTQAEAIVAEARGGADFAELARQYSEDDGTKELGGDLGPISPGQMVPEFEGAAYALDQGEISDPVSSMFGVHIIKATEKTGGTTQPLNEVRESIVDLLKQESADARASALAEAMAAEITTAADMDDAARRRGLEPQVTGFVSPGEPILGLGFSSEVTARAFQLGQGQVAGPIQTPTGPAFVTVVGIQDPSIPPLEEVEARVRDDVIRKKAFAAAQARAAEVATLLQTADDFTQAAETEELEVSTSDAIARGAAVPGVGLNAAVEAVAFSLSAGQTSDPVLTGNSAVILHVHERQEATAADFQATRETLRNDMIAEQQGQFYAAYLENVKARIRIDVRLDVFAQAAV
ncbi:MAG: SurA N-terminal domain-containing protein [Vicinamibacterales bacterium]|nr:SurA N-terminal domain-containing protein [Vicinamibacterales bacterium]